jgi:hypothetical protein
MHLEDLGGDWFLLPLLFSYLDGAVESRAIFYAKNTH